MTCDSVPPPNRRVDATYPELRESLQWVIYTAVAWTAVLIAVTSQRWDTTLSACVICFLRGRWRR